MIPINELRVGITVNTLNGYKTLSDFKMLNDAANFPGFYNPIQLTPEILAKCGFKQTKGVGGAECWDNGNIEINKEVDGYAGFASGKPFQHIHQLQNLYFDLTADELNVQL